MKQNDKIISAFRQDIELPAVVTKKADTAFDKILSEVREGTNQMKEKQNNQEKKRTPVWVKTAISAAAVCLLLICVCTANPVLAAKIPVIGRIFSMLQKTAEYPGDYTNYVQPLQEDTEETPVEDVAQGTEEEHSDGYSRTVDGVTVTLSEIYCNQQSLSISMLVEAPEAFADKIVTYQDGKQALLIEGESRFSFRDDPYVGDNYVYGAFLDEKTFAGIWRIELSGVLTGDLKDTKLEEAFTMEIDIRKVIGELAEPVQIDWGMSTEELDSMSEAEFNALYDQKIKEYGMDTFPNRAQNYWFEGPWNFTVPVTVNDADNHRVVLNDVNADGLGLRAVSMTPFELSIETEQGADMDCIVVVLDAQGKWMDSGNGNVSVLPIADHDVSEITVYLCSSETWTNEIKGHQGDADFTQYVKERALYEREVELPVCEK